jgi:hypothetical protein
MSISRYKIEFLDEKIYSEMKSSMTSFLYHDSINNKIYSKIVTNPRSYLLAVYGRNSNSKYNFIMNNTHVDGLFLSQQMVHDNIRNSLTMDTKYDTNS